MFNTIPDAIANCRALHLILRKLRSLTNGDIDFLIKIQA